MLSLSWAQIQTLAILSAYKFLTSLICSAIDCFKNILINDLLCVKHPAPLRSKTDIISLFSILWLSSSSQTRPVEPYLACTWHANSFKCYTQLKLNVYLIYFTQFWPCVKGSGAWIISKSDHKESSAFSLKRWMEESFLTPEFLESSLKQEL